MKHILIPTDFSIRSLKAVHAAVDSFGQGKLKITLFHLMTMPTDFSMLLIHKVQKKSKELISSDFNDACEVLKNKYSSKIECMSVAFGYGSSLKYMRNYLEGAKVDVVFFQAGMELDRISKDSIDMVPLLKRTGWKLMEVPASTRSIKVVEPSIADLLLAEE